MSRPTTLLGSTWKSSGGSGAPGTSGKLATCAGGGSFKRRVSSALGCCAVARRVLRGAVGTPLLPLPPPHPGTGGHTLNPRCPK